MMCLVLMLVLVLRGFRLRSDVLFFYYGYGVACVWHCCCCVLVVLYVLLWCCLVFGVGWFVFCFGCGVGVGWCSVVFDVGVGCGIVVCGVGVDFV